LIIFLCSSYHYIIYMHSRSNLCRSNVSITYYVSKKYLNNLTFNISKIDFLNTAKLSGSGGIFARDGFLPDLEKVPDSGRSRIRNPVQPYRCLDDIGGKFVSFQVPDTLQSCCLLPVWLPLPAPLQCSSDGTRRKCQEQ